MLAEAAHRGAVADADADADPDTDMEGPIIVICAEGKSVSRGGLRRSGPMRRKTF